MLSDMRATQGRRPPDCGVWTALPAKGRQAVTYWHGLGADLRIGCDDNHAVDFERSEL